MHSIHFDRFWYVLIHWYIQIYSDTFRYIKIHLDTFRYIQIHLDAFICIEILLGTSRYIEIDQPYYNSFRSIQIHFDTLVAIGSFYNHGSILEYVDKHGWSASVCSSVFFAPFSDDDDPLATERTKKKMGERKRKKPSLAWISPRKKRLTDFFLKRFQKEGQGQNCISSQKQTINDFKIDGKVCTFFKH